MDIQTVGVIGAGTMGNGIAQVFAQAGFSVRPCPLLRRMVAAGQLGRKSGQGFYPY